MALRTSLIVIVAFLVTTANGADLKKEMEQAARTLNAAYAAGDVNAIRHGTTTDHVSITSHYQFFSQAEQLKALHEYNISSYKITGMKAFPLTEDVVLVTFRADIDSTFRGKKMPSKAHVVETWVKRDGKWLQASYQQTPMANPEE